MASPVTDFCRDQYREFCILVTTEWGLSETRLNLLAPRLKAIHKRFLAIACAASVASYRRVRGEYAASIVDVCHLAIILSTKGAENSVRVLQRQCIELTLKHLYFVDHRVEHGWAQTRDSYRRPTFQTLLEYLKQTDELHRIDTGQALVDQITSDHAALSRYVHVKNRKFHDFFPFKKASRKSVVAAVRKMDAQSSTLWPALMVLLIAFSWRAYTRASQMEKKLIRSGMSDHYRQSLNRYLRSLST